MKLVGAVLVLGAGLTIASRGSGNSTRANSTARRQEPDVTDAVETGVHAVNAASYANQAAESANFANQVAVHTQEVARDAISALRYTRDALLLVKSGDSEAEAAELTSAANALEIEAGLGAHANYDESPTSIQANDQVLGKLESRLNSLETEYQHRKTTTHIYEVRNGIVKIRYQLGRLSQAEQGIEIDSAVVPFPSGAKNFGSEETANTLTHSSIAESDGMIRQIERTQSIEGKRAVFRALTHLRGASIAAYDGIARSHMQNVEEYSLTHHWRLEHPIRTLAEEESDVSYWAFPAHSGPTLSTGTATQTATATATAAAPAAAPAAAAPESASLLFGEQLADLENEEPLLADIALRSNMSYHH